MPTASLAQARRFSTELLKLRRIPRFSFQVGPIRVNAHPDQQLKSMKLQFTTGELNTVAFNLEIHDGPRMLRSRLFLSEGPWEGRSGPGSYYPNGELQFLLVHGHDRRTLHEMNLVTWLELAPAGIPGKLVLLSKTPFPGVKGGGEISNRFQRWLLAHGMSGSGGRIVLGTDADYEQLLINLLAVALLKQHVRGALVLPSLVSDLPPITKQVSGDTAPQQWVLEDEYVRETTAVDMAARDVAAAILEEAMPGDLSGLEGKAMRHFVNYYERKPELRAVAIQIHGTVCKGCGFDFTQAYGEPGHGYVEVHHLVPLSEMNGEGRVDPRTDMTVLCANAIVWCIGIPHMFSRLRSSAVSLQRLGEEADGRLCASNATRRAGHASRGSGGKCDYYWLERYARPDEIARLEGFPAQDPYLLLRS
jgi:hypothetical protein